MSLSNHFEHSHVRTLIDEAEALAADTTPTCALLHPSLFLERERVERMSEIASAHGREHEITKALLSVCAHLVGMDQLVRQAGVHAVAAVILTDCLPAEDLLALSLPWALIARAGATAR
jgi:hypothetical protein